MNRLLIICFLLFLPPTAVEAADKGLTVWLDQGVSLKNQTNITLFPIVHDQLITNDFDVAAEIASAILEKLKAAGLNISAPEDPHTLDSIGIKPLLTKYEPGSVADRWFLPGAGRTICIIRTTIVQAKSGEVIGEILSWRQVTAGGLFSVGADKYVPREAAEATAEAIVGLIRKQ